MMPRLLTPLGRAWLYGLVINAVGGVGGWWLATSGIVGGGELSKQEWLDHGRQYGWSPPQPAALIWRLPIIRHVRCWWAIIQVERHYALWTGAFGMARSGYDACVLTGAWRGWQ